MAEPHNHSNRKTGCSYTNPDPQAVFSDGHRDGPSESRRTNHLQLLVFALSFLVIILLGILIGRYLSGTRHQLPDIEPMKADLVLSDGDTQTLRVDPPTLPENVQVKTEWISSDETVASIGEISENGYAAEIETHGAGSCEITMTIQIEQKIYVLLCYEIAVESNNPFLNIDPVEETLTLKNGDCGTLQVHPLDLPEELQASAEWSSSDNSVATIRSVSEDGYSAEIEALSPGSCRITMTLHTETRSCLLLTYDISVEQPVPSAMTLSISEYTLSTNETVKIEAKVDPMDQTYHVEWNSSDERVALVEGHGEQGLTADIIWTGGGSCTITANLVGPSGKVCSKTCEIRSNSTPEYRLLGKLKMSYSSYYTLELFHYDSDGHLIGADLYSYQVSSKNLKYYVENGFDMADSEYVSWREYRDFEVDDQERILTATLHDMKGGEDEKVSFSYDSKGRLIKEEYADYGYYYIYQYEKDQMIESYLSPSGEVMDERVFDADYDGYGNIIYAGRDSNDDGGGYDKIEWIYSDYFE